MPEDPRRALIVYVEELERELEFSRKALVEHHNISHLSPELVRFWGAADGCPICAKLRAELKPIV